MENRTNRALGILLGLVLVSIVNFDIANAQAVQPTAAAGTAGRVAKFINHTDLGNSVLFETGGKIGLGTNAPLSALDVRGSVNLWTAKPYLMFRDTTTGNLRSYIRSWNGALGFFGEDYVNASNASAFVQIDRDGRLGIGTFTPRRAIQIGPSLDAMFTIEPSDASPNAGYIRFGDGTGWQLHIGRSRQSSGGPLTTGTTGVIMTIKDNSPSGIGGTVIFKGGVQVDSLFGSGSSPTPVCRNSLNLLSVCSSSRRYKTDIKPFSGGLQLINRLQPVSFIWKADQHPDIGLIAEDVAKVEPRLTFNTQHGVVEGVNYSQLTTALINAVKEQQEQLEQQQQLIEELQSAVALLER